MFTWEFYFIIRNVRKEANMVIKMHLVNPVKDVPEGFGGQITHSVFIFIFIGKEFTEESTVFGQQYFVDVEAGSIVQLDHSIEVVISSPLPRHSLG